MVQFFRYNFSLVSGKIFPLYENNRYKWNKTTLLHILTRQEYCGDVVNFKTTKHFRDKLPKLILADSLRFSASDGQKSEKSEILR